MKNVYILLLLVAVQAIAQLQPGKNTLTINSRSVDVYLPADYSANKTYPVLFGLHPFGGEKTSTQDGNEATFVTDQQIISVYPQGENIIFVGRAWNVWSETNAVLDNDDVAFLSTVYNQIKTQLGTAFNANKVMAYGFSNGGAMAMEMVKKTNLFKGIAIRSMALINNENIATSASKVPMIFVHGTSDTTVPYNGGTGDKPLSPNFDAIKNTVSKWATHNGCVVKPTDIKFLASGGIRDFWFREYANKNVNAPIYFYALPDAPHATNGGFANRNIKKALIRMMKSPSCYGLSRNSEKCK